MKYSIFCLLIFLPFIKSSAQDFSGYEKKYFIYKTDTLPYRILLPVNYEKTKKYPLIIFLHGSGERGNDNEKQLLHGGDLFLQDSLRKAFPAIVVFPQCADNQRWSNFKIAIDSVTHKREGMIFPISDSPTVMMDLLIKLVNQLERNYPVKKNQCYVGGLSLGGMGTYDLVKRMPNTFAAAFPICGGANPAIAPQLKNTSWWIFHGLKDDTVNPDYSRQMAKALEDAGAKVKITLYPNANHNSWDSAFAEKDLLPWLFSQKR
jgi:predicted peptidase